jgi:hypothetical protein
VNDQYLSRRAYFEDHGKWPVKGRKDAPTERYTVTFERAAPKPHVHVRIDAHAPTPVPYESPEAAAWRAAYAGPGELGPVGGTWPADGRHIPRVVWRLPTSSSR